MKQLLLYTCFLLLCGKMTAQDKSNSGTDFWLGYGNNVLFDHDFPVNNQNLVLYLSAEEATTITVSVNGTSWTRTLNLPANTVDFSVILPKDGADDCRIINEGIFNRAIHIQSTKPIVAYAHQYDAQLSGATMLLPVETYGHTYYSINYLQPYVPGTPGKNWFFVIASEDNTTIEITTTDTTEGGILPNQPFRVNLNKGQLYNVFAKVANDVGKDLTASKIVSVTGTDGNCHPIAVFSGCSRFIVCTTDGGEVAQQQIFPSSAWGTRYLTYHSFNVTTNPLTTPFLNFFRVMVMNPATVVKRNGVPLTGLQNNAFYEFQSTSGDYIEADNPIMVCQYTPNSNQCTGTSLSPQGDPELIFLSPIEQNIKKARIYNTRNNNITINYLTVIIPNAGINSLKIDGAVVPASMRTVHPNNNAYTVVARRLLGPAAQHTIESDSAFSAILYGTGLYESYGYIAGTLINNLNAIGSIKNVYSNATANSFTCPGSPFQFSIKVAYRVSSLQWLFSQVPGLSPSADVTENNPVPIDSLQVNGRRYYTYRLSTNFTFSDTGTFFIPVVYTAADIDNCQKTDRQSITVNVNKPPVANYDLTYNGCSYDTAFFAGLADINNYPINKYTWQYDDNTSDTIQNAVKIFSEGNHPFTLKVITDNGCIDDTTGIVTTFPKPVAKFGYDRNVCLGDSILFRDSSSVSQGSINNWRWNMADGNSFNRTTADSFYHRYAAVNDYRVALVVSSDKGCRSDSSFVTVKVNKVPDASFTIFGKPCPDSNFIFIPTITNNGNNIQSLTWNYGDGRVDTVSNIGQITHAYQSVQTNITTTLTVNAGVGCVSNTVTQVIPEIFPKPESKFVIQGNTFCPKSDFNFIYTGTAAVNNWQWDFGNGLSTAQPPVARRYNTAGNFIVNLRVQTAQGCGSDPFSLPLTIHAAPVIDAGPTILKGPGNPATIQATSNSNIGVTYEWTPALSLSNTQILNPVTTATNDIVYTLKAISATGNCSSTDSVAVKIIRQLYIPNAFSPNNDQTNDDWNIPGITGNPLSMVTIFNRWGEKIFESRGYAYSWDGTFKGLLQPMGAYYYQIKPDVNKPMVYTGYVMIVR